MLEITDFIVVNEIYSIFFAFLYHCIYTKDIFLVLLSPFLVWV